MDDKGLLLCGSSRCAELSGSMDGKGLLQGTAGDRCGGLPRWIVEEIIRESSYITAAFTGQENRLIFNELPLRGVDADTGWWRARMYEAD